MFFGTTVTFSMPDPWTYWPSFLFAAVFVFMQTTTEEMVFRGYAAQAVRRFTASPGAIIVVTALLFAVPHYHNVVAIGWPWWGILTFALSAALYAWMVLRTGSLWMPIGWHWMNNFFLSRIYVVEADVGGKQDAFFHSIEEPSLGWSGLLTKAVTYLLVAFLIHYLVSRREAAHAGEEAETANLRWQLGLAHPLSSLREEAGTAQEHSVEATA